MSRKYWLILTAIIVLVTGYSLRIAVPAPLPLNHGNLDLSQWNLARQGPIQLAGEWIFYPDQLLTPSTYLARNESPLQLKPPQQLKSPQRLNVPAPWNHIRENQEFSGDGFGSYVLKISGLNTATKDLALFQQLTCSSSKTYFFAADAPTNTPLSSLGTVGRNANETIPNQKATISALDITPGKIHYLLIQIANFDHRLGGLCKSVYLGTLQQLFDANYRNLIGQGLTIAIVFSITLYAFAIYLYTTTNRSPLWLGLWALFATLNFWTHANLWEQAFGFGGEWGFRFHSAMEYCTTVLIGPLIVYFCHHSQTTNYLSATLLRNNLLLALALCAIIIVTPTHSFTQYVILLMSFSLIQLAIALYILSRAIKDHLPHSMLLFVSIAPLILTTVIDFRLSISGSSDRVYSEYAMVFFIFIQCLIQGQRLSSAVRQSKRLSSSLSEEVRHQTASLEEKNHELLIARSALEEANRDLKALSITDGLTGAYNRLYFDRQFLVEWQRSRREQDPLSLMLVDIDHFKMLNDTHGHLAGDCGLKNIVTHMQSIFKRSSDIVCRYGGEEFVVLLPNTTPEQAALNAEALRKLIESTPIHYNDMEIYYTVSIGVGGLIPELDSQPLDLLSATDQALYQVKRSGRNGIRLANISTLNVQT